MNDTSNLVLVTQEEAFRLYISLPDFVNSLQYKIEILEAQAREATKIQNLFLTKMFKLTPLSSISAVERHIANCEGFHMQQAVYSTCYKGLTQICYQCREIRTNILTNQ